jgi:hypothetical protein
MTIKEYGGQKSIAIDEIHDNTSQELIYINDDKLKLILIEHLAKVENGKAWLTPFGLLLTVILVFCSADFKLAFGIPADTWRAVFIIVGLICLLWLIYCLSKMGKSQTLDDVIKIVKNKSNPTN